MKKSPCVVIRHSLLTLTGDFKKAIILNQLLYWSERVRDTQQLFEEEHNRFTHTSSTPHDAPSLQHGWIYKKAEELATEIMIGISPKSVRAHLKFMVSQGWLFERRNPRDKMDRTLQYRVNFVQLHHDLTPLGYVLKKDLFSAENRQFTHPTSNVAEKSHPPITPPTSISTISNTRPNPVETPRQPLAKGSDDVSTSSKPLDTQGIEACDSTPKTTTEITYSETTTTHTPNVVCVIQNRIQELFGRKLAKHKVLQLIQLAKEVDVDLAAMIENTYEYHTRVERCRNISGAIKYAVENGGWEILTPSMRDVKKRQIEAHQSLPRAVRESIENPYVEPESVDPELVIAQERMRAKLRQMDERIAEMREMERQGRFSSTSCELRDDVGFVFTEEDLRLFYA